MTAKDKVLFMLEYHGLNDDVLSKKRDHFIVKLIAYILISKYRYSKHETSIAICKCRQTTSRYIKEMIDYEKKAPDALEKKINKIIKKINRKEFM